MPRKKQAGKESGNNRGLFKVAGLGEIRPGRRKVVSVDRAEIALFNLDGDFYAISNRCPHAGFPLTYAPIYGDVIICPNHAWVFNVKTGECVTKSSCPVKTYRVVVEGDDIKVDL